MRPFFSTDVARLGDELNTDSASILLQLTVVRFPAGARIYSTGAPFNGVYLVQYGIAKTCTCVEGLEVPTTLALGGDVLGIDSLHSNAYLNDAISVGELEAIWVPAECLLLLLRESAAFRSLMYNAIGRALSQCSVMMNILSTSDAEERVAFLLLKVYVGLNTDLEKKKTFDIGLSRAEMAAYLGLRVETVSRKLSRFSELGYIRVQGRRIHVRSYDGLAKICRSSLLPTISRTPPDGFVEQIGRRPS
jgi:CRP/FNR family transcriptional regulator